MFAFTIFWTYIELLPVFPDLVRQRAGRDDLVSSHRWEGSWETISMVILFGHFVLAVYRVAVPGFTKRTPDWLGSWRLDGADALC